MAGRFSFRKPPAPTPPISARLPSHGPRRSSSVPLFPLLGACMIVVVALQGIKLLYENNLTTSRPFDGEKRSVSDAISRLGDAHRRKGDYTPTRLNAEIFPHDLEFAGTGLGGGGHTIIVFTDPACGACRRKLDAWLKDVPALGLRVVYKYWPSDRADISGGLVMEIARRNALAQKLMQRLQTYPDDVPADRMATLLDTLGVDMNTQHDLLTNKAQDLTSTIGQDIDQGTHLGLGDPPQLILDDYLLDGDVLSPAHIPLYVQRMNRQETIIQTNDYWLNDGR